MTMEELRAERNNRLAETDYWALVDQPEMSGPMYHYRQELRDLPAKEDLDLNNVEWPVKPEVE